jgi:hypothetical protein
LTDHEYAFQSFGDLSAIAVKDGYAAKETTAVTCAAEDLQRGNIKNVRLTLQTSADNRRLHQDYEIPEEQNLPECRT